jgi:hypothetical protein
MRLSLAGFFYCVMLSPVYALSPVYSADTQCVGLTKMLRLEYTNASTTTKEAFDFHLACKTHENASSKETGLVRQGFGSATLKAAISSNDQACDKDEEYKTQFHSQYESGTNLFDQAYSIISQCLNANTSGWLVDSKFDDENPNRFYIALSNRKDSGDVRINVSDPKVLNCKDSYKRLLPKSQTVTPQKSLQIDCERRTSKISIKKREVESGKQAVLTLYFGGSVIPVIFPDFHLMKR